MAKIQVYKNYNNYYNRTLKRTDPESLPIYEDDINFDPADGVNTSAVVGKHTMPYTQKGDYLYITEENGDITHWFILEAVRIRGGQFRLYLRRDLTRDYYSEWVNATADIKRATVSEDSPYIYNEEPIATNQIKVGETLLKDDTGLSWIVGFIDRDYNGGTINIQQEFIPDETYDSLELFDLYKKYGNGKYWYSTVFNYSVSMEILEINIAAIGGERNQYKKDTYVNWVFNNQESSTYEDIYGIEYGERNDFDLFIKQGDAGGGTTNKIVLRNYTSDVIFDLFPKSEQSDYEKLIELNGKIIKAGSKYYEAKVYSELHEFVAQESEKLTELESKYNEIFSNYSGKITSGKNPVYKIYAQQRCATLSLTEVSSTSLGVNYELTIPESISRKKNKSAPFDVFCIPYAGDKTTINVEDNKFEIEEGSKNITAMNIASEIGRQLGTNCYDIQLLPFAPFGGYSRTGDELTITGTEIEGRISYVKQNEEKVLPIIWSASSSGTFNIILDITVGNTKLENQCDLWRIVSPNYNGTFEFSVAKNGGLKFVNVDYTYLPYSSYIHVNPDFGNLYGKDFNDARGLICQGDFSIMYLSDAWVEYQINNKNYDNIFNRQIQNMEVSHKYDKIDQIVNATVGAVGAGVQTGMVTGNVYAGIGAGLLSAGGGVADLAISESKYKEQKSYAQDVHAYQLDNVKALPNSIAKTTAYTENNKIFPIIEYYTCTDEEKVAVARAIANQGMTVGFIDTPIKYIENDWSYESNSGIIEDRGFISCELIDISISEDSHVVQALNEELLKGVYTK